MRRKSLNLTYTFPEVFLFKTRKIIKVPINCAWGFIFSILLIFFLPFSSLIAQPSTPNLQEKEWFSISDGLAHNGVTCIFEDSKGYLWIGTYDGLNRYDGYIFETFKNDIEKKNFISNRIRTINEDDSGNLWIGTDEGISIYDPDKRNFQNIYSNRLNNKQLSGPIVRKIIFSKKHKVAICATEGFGVLVLGKDFKFIDQYLPPSEKPEQPILFFDGIALGETHYLFSTSIGLLLFDFEQKQFTPVLQDNVDYGKSIIKTGDNELMVARRYGVTFFNYEKSNTGYDFQFQGNKFHQAQFVTTAMDTLGNLWLGSNINGVIQIEDFKNSNVNEKGSERYFRLETGELRVSCFYFSQISGAWVGTFNKGFYQLALTPPPFHYYHIGMDYDYGIGTNRISSMSPLDEHRVYVVATLGGVALFNTKEEKFEPLPFTLPNDYKNRVSKVFIDSRENVWLKISDDYGLVRVRKGATTIEKITEPDFSLFQDMSFRHIIEDKDGNIWIGAVEGVYKIIINDSGDIKKIVSLNDNPFFTSNPIANIRYIYEDTQHDFIWIGSHAEGLFRIKTKEGKELHELSVNRYVYEKDKPGSLPSNFVSFITRLPDDNLWIATERGGICKVVNSENEPEFITFSESKGLSNNVVKSIIYDNGNLWIPTNIGLNKYNISENRFRRISKKDGLPFEDFEYASVKMDNGLILLSGPDGFIYFDPHKLKKEETLPKLEFSDLKLFNKVILPNDTVNGRVILKHSLNNTSKINFKHHENVFSIQIKSLHYSNPKSHYLQYQLLPINENWIETTSDQQEITYNVLPPGDYTFRVRASNSLNEWTEPRQLELIIHPPFWKTAWAYSLYFLLGAMLIGLVMFVILRFQALNHNLEIEKIEKANIKELNDSKLRFFSNISHEIKTPIALISGPVELLLEHFRGITEVNDKLHLIKRQSKKIAQLIDQAHGFQKADANALKVKKSPFSFNTFVVTLMRDFEAMAESDNKLLEVKSEGAEIYVEADKGKLEIIFNNLLNNAFKYTNAGDSITFNYKKEKKNVIVKISDTGNGILPEDLPHIFERFYQAQNQNTYLGGAGIGLAFSKKLVDLHYGFIEAWSEMGKGTTFTVRLPIVQVHLSEAEKNRERKILSEESNFKLPGVVDRKMQLSTLKLEENYAETTIFLIEDNNDLRIFVADVLKKFFKVVTFSNGKECLDRMKEEWPDLILSDVLMPKVNGFELCRHIKSEINTSHIPVILLTACTSIEEQIQGLEVGADAYIKKPFDIEHLILSIATLLRIRKQLRERFQIDYPVALEKIKLSENDTIFLEKLYELMEANLDNEDLELDSFSKDLYLNRTHFYQKVKALTNRTPYEILKDFRLKKAAELLVQKKLAVSEVYTMTGFKSRTHFSKLFREKYNISPGKYGKR